MWFVYYFCVCEEERERERERERLMYCMFSNLLYCTVVSLLKISMASKKREREKTTIFINTHLNRFKVSRFKNHSHTMSIATIGISLSSLPNVRKRLREEIKFSSSSLSSEDDSLSNENGECSSVSNSCPPRKRRRRTRYENDRIFVKLKK